MEIKSYVKDVFIDKSSFSFFLLVSRLSVNLYRLIEGFSSYSMTVVILKEILTDIVIRFSLMIEK